VTEITATKSRGSGGVAAAARLLAPLALMALIFWASAQPYDGDPMAWWEVLGRKLGHFSGYAALTVAWAWALAGRIRYSLAIAAAVSLAYAVTDEYHQTFVEGRSGKASDVGIDALGIAAAVAVIEWRNRTARRRR
jgi:VanZ family protein